jgi:hypothetical protein
MLMGIRVDNSSPDSPIGKSLAAPLYQPSFEPIPIASHATKNGETNSSTNALNNSARVSMTLKLQQQQLLARIENNEISLKATKSSSVSVSSGIGQHVQFGISGSNGHNQDNQSTISSGNDENPSTRTSKEKSPSSKSGAGVGTGKGALKVNPPSSYASYGHNAEGDDDDDEYADDTFTEEGGSDKKKKQQHHQQNSTTSTSVTGVGGGGGSTSGSHSGSHSNYIQNFKALIENSSGGGGGGSGSGGGGGGSPGKKGPSPSKQQQQLSPNAADMHLAKRPTAESERENAERVDALLMELFPERYEKKKDVGAGAGVGGGKGGKGTKGTKALKSKVLRYFFIIITLAAVSLGFSFLLLCSSSVLFCFLLFFSHCAANSLH